MTMMRITRENKNAVKIRQELMVTLMAPHHDGECDADDDDAIKHTRLQSFLFRKRNPYHIIFFNYLHITHNPPVQSSVSL